MVSTRRRPTRRRGRAKQRRRSRADPLARERALEALNRMRTGGLSLTRAARAAHTTAPTVRKYVGSTLTKTGGGRYAVTPFDRYRRHIWLLTDSGKVEIVVQGSRPASRVARYMAAVDQYLRDGSREDLQKFEGKTIRSRKITYPFLTDPAALDHLAYADEVSFDRLYVLRA